jgi:hypothetical protein
MHFIRLNSCLLSTKICSVFDVKSRLSCQHILSQLETAAQYLTYSMRQFEAPGGSSFLKLLVTDLWTLFWTISFIRLMRLNSRLLSTKICSVLDVKSRLSRQHTLSQLETTVQYSTHTMYKHRCQDEASMLARVIAYGVWRREVKFMHFIRLNSCLLSTKICSVFDVKSRLSCQHILSQLETAAQYLTYSMRQFEAPGGSSFLKLLVTDLWTLFWTISFIRLMRLNSRLLSTKICSVLDVKSRLSRQHTLSQLETTVQYSTHTMYKHRCQDEVQL